MFSFERRWQLFVVGSCVTRSRRSYSLSHALFARYVSSGIVRSRRDSQPLYNSIPITPIDIFHYSFFDLYTVYMYISNFQSQQSFD